MHLTTHSMPKDRGFTLVEVLFAITLLSVGILAALTMITNTVSNNASALGTSSGTFTAAKYVEQQLNLDYDDTDLGDGSHSTTTVPGYNVSWTVEDHNPTEYSKKIKITVQSQTFPFKSTEFVYYRAKWY
ncbi:type IV pilus modification PilV family protein [Thiovibrio sp. JS02]